MTAAGTASAITLRSPLFDGISRADQQEILAEATLRTYAPKQLIVRQGAPANRFFLVLSGCARFFLVTESGRKLPMLWAIPGDAIGGMGVVLHQRNYVLNCEVVRPSQILVWSREAIRKHFTRLPRMMDNGLHIASSYVEQLLSAHVSLTCNTARERLSAVLISYATALGVPNQEGVMIEATSEDFAQAAHITKYTTCRLLAQWQKSGAIVKTRGKTILCDPKRLV